MWDSLFDPGRGGRFPVIWKPLNFLPAFFAKMLEEKLEKPLVLTNLVTEKAPNRHKNSQNRLF